MIGDEDLAGRIERAVGDLDRVIRDLRNYIFGLRPGFLRTGRSAMRCAHLRTSSKIRPAS